MCGIFGGFGHGLSTNERQNIVDLGILSQFRGTDSTGIAVLSRKTGTPLKNGKITATVYKNVIDPSGFFQEKRPKELLSGPVMSTYAVIGHTRAATMGDVTVENAHPYIIDERIVGVHNGSISNFRPSKAQEATRTDSRALYERIASKPLAEALADCGHDAAFALAWYDAKDKSLNFIRNERRPLWLMKGTGGTVYFASEYRMLEFVARGGTSGINSDELVVTPLVVDTLYKFDVLDPKNFSKVYVPYEEIRKERLAATTSKDNERHTPVPGRSFLHRGWEHELQWERELRDAIEETEEKELAALPFIPDPKPERTDQAAKESSFPVATKAPIEVPPPSGGKALPASITRRPVLQLPKPNGAGQVAPLPPPKTPSYLDDKRVFSPAGRLIGPNKRRYFRPDLADPTAGLPRSVMNHERTGAPISQFLSPDSIQFAESVFSFKGAGPFFFPRMIKNDKGACKRLYYQGPYGLYIPSDNAPLKDLLDLGCVLTGTVPKIYDRVRWLSDNEFIMERETNNPYLTAYYKGGSMEHGTFRSQLVYLSDATAAALNTTQAQKQLN